MSDGSNLDAWLTVPEAVKYLRLSRATVYELMKDGRLPFFYVKGTRQRRLKKSDLDKLMIPGAPEEADDEGV